MASRKVEEIIKVKGSTEVYLLLENGQEIHEFFQMQLRVKGERRNLDDLA